ncbi:MAG: hypothetical protein AAGM46_01470 [Cyanobacteria bacterium J06582_2]
MFDNLFTLINHLFTAILLVILLFACQEPKNQKIEGIPFKYEIPAE